MSRNIKQEASPVLRKTKRCKRKMKKNKAKAAKMDVSTLDIPNAFLSPGGDSAYFCFIVEGIKLYACRKDLAAVSPVLDRMVNDTRFKDAREGQVELEGKRVETIVKFLCWLCHRPNPAWEGQNLAFYEIGFCLHKKDLDEMLDLADEWDVKGLRQTCCDVLVSFVNSLGDQKLEKDDAFGILVLTERVWPLPASDMHGILSAIFSAGLKLSDVRVLNLHDGVVNAVLSAILRRVTGTLDSLINCNCSGKCNCGQPNNHKSYCKIADTPVCPAHARAAKKYASDHQFVAENAPFDIPGF